MKPTNILVIGANGQLGSVLTEQLRSVFGNTHVIASDIRTPTFETGPFEILDMLDGKRLAAIIETYQITQLYHLAAILSATGEAKPLKTWNINLDGLLTVLEVAREKKLDKVFFPSSIAVFGKQTPRINTPQTATLAPATVYGMSKEAGENWCQYYFERYGLDVRSVRYPGVIGYQSLPGGGTTDYAVDIYHKAVKGELFTCFLEKDTRLPMIYMEDSNRATLELMEAPAEKIKIRTSYNLAGMSFSPIEIAHSIQKIIPDFQIQYVPDFRQKIAESWPESIDDSPAQKDWGWQPKFDLNAMTREMISHLK